MTTPAGQVQLVLTTRERIDRRTSRRHRLEAELRDIQAADEADLAECIQTQACHYTGCLAGPGEPCMTVSGGAMEGEVHFDRWRRFYWRDG